uniref:Uncharacterized protein n=1 Tax=Anguilla anguilla TaxID=7936 RepID=A0A0E9W0B8_ANGAN
MSTFHLKSFPCFNLLNC